MSDRCRVYEVDGQPVSVRGGQPLTEQDQLALAEVVRAARRLMAAEDPDARAAREERQRAAIARIRSRAGLEPP